FDPQTLVEAQMGKDGNDRCVEKQSAKVEVRSKVNRRNILLAGTTLAAASALQTSVQIAQAQQAPSGRKPNILVIFGDDIGYWNISAYNRGMMGYRTPNIDHVAREGAIFTDLYAQQSCTAGRAIAVCNEVTKPRFETTRIFTKYLAEDGHPKSPQ